MRLVIVRTIIWATLTLVFGPALAPADAAGEVLAWSIAGDQLIRYDLADGSPQLIGMIDTTGLDNADFEALSFGRGPDSELLFGYEDENDVIFKLDPDTAAVLAVWAFSDVESPVENPGMTVSADGTLYVVSEFGALYRADLLTPNGGTYTLVLEAAFEGLGVSGVAADPVDPSRFYGLAVNLGGNISEILFARITLGDPGTVELLPGPISFASASDGSSQFGLSFDERGELWGSIEDLEGPGGSIAFRIDRSTGADIPGTDVPLPTLGNAPPESIALLPEPSASALLLTALSTLVVIRRSCRPAAVVSRVGRGRARR